MKRFRPVSSNETHKIATTQNPTKVRSGNWTNPQIEGVISDPYRNLPLHEG